MKKAFIVIAIMATFLLFGTQAMADSILFPYFTSGGGNVTFIQIVNTAAVNTTASGGPQGKMDYVFYYNSGNEICKHYDDSGKMTEKDILLYEVTGVYPGQLLPGDTTSTSPKLTVSPAWGFMAVRHNTKHFTTANEGSLFGQAIVANVSTGTAFMYNAINDPGEDLSYMFSTSSTDEFVISWLPEAYASTAWYFFPVDDWGDLFSYISAFNETVEIGGKFAGVVDNNESAKSGISELPIGCWVDDSGPIPVWSQYFFYTLPQLMSIAQYNVVKLSGGFTDADIQGDETGYIYKFMTSSVLGKTLAGFIYEPQTKATESYTK